MSPAQLSPPPLPPPSPPPSPPPPQSRPVAGSARASPDHDGAVAATGSAPDVAHAAGEDIAASADEDATPLVSPASLLFEVSFNTGRLHILTQQESGGYIHLGSLHPSELAAAQAAAEDRHQAGVLRALPPALARSAVAREAAMAFLQAWDALLPVQRKRLCESGVPLRLPLHAALEAAVKAHATAPSTRRTASADELVPPPPAGSAQHFVMLRPGGAAGRDNARVARRAQWQSEGGMWLCIGCNLKPGRLQYPRRCEARAQRRCCWTVRAPLLRCH